MNPLVGVLVGGGLTLLGTTLVEVVKARAGSRQRLEQRRIQGDDFSRSVVEEVRTVAVRYRAVLREYREAPGPSAPPDVQARFAAVRTEFLAQVPRVPDGTKAVLLAWETEGVEWGQNNGPSGREDRAWREAMDSCGQVEVDSFTPPSKRRWWQIF